MSNLKEIQPCEIVVELLALFLDVLEDGSDHADDGNDETAKGNCAQVKDLEKKYDENQRAFRVKNGNRP